MKKIAKSFLVLFFYQKFSLSVLLICLVLSFAACGSDSDSDEDDGWVAEYAIGDTGPAGGIIFYVTPAGFKVIGYGNPSDTGYFAEYTAHYLEAASANEGSSIEWGDSGTLIAVVTTFSSTSDSKASSIGNGRSDTQIIANHLNTNTSETGRAAQVCANKTVTVGGTVFNDWFLPSLGELNEMYKAKGETGIPTTGYYWSSSENDVNTFAWMQNFVNGNQLGGSKYATTYLVRAVRAF